jgi:thymidylate synthase (FAD)
VLPVSLYTQFYWTVSARNLMHFIDLRADAPAQWEIQRYAEALGRFFALRMPWTWTAFLEHAWKGVNPLLDEEKRRCAAAS